MKALFNIAFLFLPLFLIGQINLVPQVQKLILQNGELRITEPTISISSPKLKPLSDLLAQDISKLTNIHLTESTAKGSIHLSIDTQLTNEEYQIRIDESIKIIGTDYQSVNHGVTTLLQLMKFENDVLIFPKLSIKDYSENHFRSLMIDVARQETHLSTLKQAVELCRLYKVKYLQIHFSDHQAFTFPSTHYPTITEGAHSYTMEEMKELADYAKIRGIDIIPEIDGPGHSKSMKAALPEVFGAEEYSVLDMTMDTMYAAMAILFAEMDAVFDPPYCHVGADEVYFNEEYLNAPKVVEYMTKRGYNEEDMKREYVVKMDKIVKDLGKKTMAWESFKASNEGEKVSIPNDILVNAWETLYELPQNYINEGFDIINTSWKPYYTVRSQRWHPEYVYSFGKYTFANHWVKAPSHTPFDIEPSTQVKGGQMCAWEQFDVEQIDGLRSRIPAFAETYWTGEKRPGYEDYAARFEKTDQLFNQLISATNVSISGNEKPVSIFSGDWKGEDLPNPNGVQTNYNQWFSESLTIAIEALTRGNKVHYTTDGRNPDVNSKLYSNPLTFTETTHLRFRTYNSGNEEVGYQQYLFELRPIRAKLKGLKTDGRTPEPYHYQNEYNSPLSIAFAMDVRDAEIRYTIDGEEPTMNSTLYQKPFQLSNNQEEITVRARAFKNGQPYGEEWRPADYYDFVKYWAPARFYRFGKK